METHGPRISTGLTTERGERELAATIGRIFRLTTIAASLCLNSVPAMAAGAVSLGDSSEIASLPALRLTQELFLSLGHASGPANAKGYPSSLEENAGRPKPAMDCSRLRAVDWQALTLADSLEHFLCTSPELIQANAAVRKSEQTLTVSASAGTPQWRATSAYNAFRNFNSSGQAGQTLEASIGFAWSLLDFGRRDADIRAAREALSAASASRSNVAMEQVLSFLQLYGDAVIAEARLKSTEQAKETATQTTEAARARYEAKVSSRIDYLQSNTALSQARLDHVRAQANWSSARSRLVLALGGKPNQSIMLYGWDRWATGTPPVASDEIETSEILDMLAERHPRVQAAIALARAAEANLDLTRANAGPEITVSASVGKARNWGAAGTGTIPNSSAFIIASIPLFDGSRLDAAIGQSQAAVDDARAFLELERRAVLQSLWETHEALLASREAMRMSESLLSSAESTYEVAIGRYKAGIGSMLELLNAQGSLADARRQRAEIVMSDVSALTAARLSRSSSKDPEQK